MPYSQADLEAAIERLTGAEGFRAAEAAVAAQAPALQRVLTETLGGAGWFDEPHQAAVLKAATTPDPDARLSAVRTLLAEETRVAMMVGVAVGWALGAELGAAAPGEQTPNNETKEI